MSMEEIKVNVNLKDYLDKMSPEDSATIATMCTDKLCAKAQELKDLYLQLAKSYGIEMGVTELTLLVQVSSPKLPVIPVRCLLGTSDGIKHALAVMNSSLNELANMKKEEKNG